MLIYPLFAVQTSKFRKYKRHFKPYKTGIFTCILSEFSSYLFSTRSNHYAQLLSIRVHLIITIYAACHLHIVSRVSQMVVSRALRREMSASSCLSSGNPVCSRLGSFFLRILKCRSDLDRTRNFNDRSARQSQNVKGTWKRIRSALKG